MRFDEFYGQHSVIGELAASFRSQRVVHGFLFTGPSGCGKKALADICAQALLCKGEGDKPCGVCSPCLRAQKNVHPDLIRLTTKKASLGVEDIRTLLDALSEKPFEGGRRAVCIYDPMTPQAQNALLKTLEEPPEGTAFFITALSTASLLPTVVSRLRVIQLGALDEETCMRALQQRGIDPQRAQLLTQLAGGLLGRAIEMEEDPDFWQLREDAFQLVGLLAKGDVVTVSQKFGPRKDDGAKLLQLVVSFLSDALRVLHETKITAVDKQGELALVAKNKGVRGLSVMIDAALAAQNKLKSNVTWQNVVETLAYGCIGGNT